MQFTKLIQMKEYRNIRNERQPERTAELTESIYQLTGNWLVVVK